MKLKTKTQAQSDQKKIAIILRQSDEQKTLRVIDLLQHVYTPRGYELELRIETGSRAQAYQKGLDRTSAAIRFFIDDSISNLDEDIFINLSRHFENVPNLGLIGLIGSEIPVNGDLRNAQSIYGSYSMEDGEDIYSVPALNPLFEQKVQAVDGAFIGIRGDVDVHFDESIGDFFVGASICCRVAKEGFLTVVPMQSETLAMFDSPSVYMEFEEEYDESEFDSYDRQKLKFKSAYELTYLPLVSILIPAYNQPEFFRQALNSAVKQTYPNIEILVGDDSDNDEVKQITEQFARSYRNVKYDNHGGSLGVNGWKNMQKLLNDSRGKYIQFLFHDDLLYPEKISRMMEYYQQDLNEEIAFVTSSRDNIDADGNAKSKPRSPFVPFDDQIFSSKQIGSALMNWHGNFIGELTTVLLRKKDLWQEKLGEYRVGCYLGMQDRSMWDVSTFLELGRKKYKVIFIRDCLSAFRSHDEQNQSDKNIRALSMLDWISMLFLSYVNRTYIETEEEFKLSLNDYLEIMQFNLFVDSQTQMQQEISEEYIICSKIREAFRREDVNEIVSKVVEYINANIVESEASKDLSPLGRIFS